jgi:hypothetical protein
VFTSKATFACKRKHGHTRPANRPHRQTRKTNMTPTSTTPQPQPAQRTVQISKATKTSPKSSTHANQRCNTANQSCNKQNPQNKPKTANQPKTSAKPQRNNNTPTHTPIATNKKITIYSKISPILLMSSRTFSAPTFKSKPFNRSAEAPGGTHPIALT